MRFEAALEKPVVPGELASWASSVSECCSRAVRAFRRSVDEEHAQRYAEIGDRDGGLLRRVQRMQQEDRALLEAAAGLDAETSRLSDEAGRAGSLGSELEGSRLETVERGLDFVIRVRTQESALRTWYGEALYRDRGTVD